MAIDIETWIKVAAFGGGGLAMGLGAVGAALGEGYAAGKANEAIARNSILSGDIFKVMLVGQAIAESAAIFALVVAMVLLFSTFSTESILIVSALLGAGLCMGFGAIGAGVGAGFPAGEACTGIARQPAMKNRLTTNMLIGSAVCQTPAIFALVAAFILLFTNFAGRAVSPTWAALIGAGIAAGFGAIGSGLGGGLVAKSSCQGVARQPLAVTPVTNIMLLGQAVTQTPAIYGLLICFVLLFRGFPEAQSISEPAALLAAGLCTGIGALGPAIGIGYTGKNAVKWIARREEAVSDLTRIMLVGMAVAESTAIYALVISLVLIFVI
ncbi:MAG: ATP synthase F0 subunit C [Thermodesulfobacteriota bacterium]